jgi:hypothetical protein
LAVKSLCNGEVGLPVVTPAPLHATVATKSFSLTVIALVVTVLPVVVVSSIPLPIGPFWSTPVYN